MTLKPRAVAASTVARYDRHQSVPTLDGLIGSRTVLAPSVRLNPSTMVVAVRCTVR
jgi:hypothetical protein